MNKFKNYLLLICVFSLFGFILTSCAPDLSTERNNAQKAMEDLIASGASEEQVAEVQALIDEAERLLAEGDVEGARSKMEEARFRALEIKGELAKEGVNVPLEDLSGDEIDIGLADVFFDYDQSRVRPDAAPLLNENARIINSNLDRVKVVIVEGFCDVRGTDEYNLALGDRRANSAMSYLVGIGVPPEKVEAVSKGETDEWSQGTTESAYQQNRRAHFRVIAR